MNKLILTDRFKESSDVIKDKIVRKQIGNKIRELEFRAPLGKKLQGNKYWSIHVNKFRIIYEIKGNEIRILDLLQRKHEYREL